MIDMLQRVRPGQMIVAPSAFTLEPARNIQPSREPTPVLTPRELEVLTLLGKGVPLNSIAQILGISLHTCRGYVKSLHNKLGVSSQLEAVIKAQNLGLIGSS